MVKMTLEKLAGMTMRGFKKLDEKIGKRIDGVEGRLEGKINGLDARMGRLEFQMKDLKEDVGNWRTITQNHENRIEHIETETGITN